jgi:tetratricopeptide (TPR) repeat protein
MSVLRRWSLVLLSMATSCVFAADPAPVAKLVDHGHYKQAQSILEKSLSANPKDAQALTLMAKIKLAFFDSDTAAQLARQAIDIDPKNVEAHITLADAVSRKADDAGIFEKARIARQLKSELELVLSIDPKNLDALEGMAAFYREAPGITGGSMSKAREMTDKIMALDPVRGYLAKVDLAAQDKHFDQLEGLYLKAVEASPDSYLANAHIAAMYAGERSKNYDKAIQYAQKTVQLDPTRITPYLTLATAYAAKEQWAELDRSLATSEKAVPDNLAPYYRAALTLLLAGKDLPRAEGYFRKYLSQAAEGEAPPMAAAHWRLGQVLEKQGKKQEAIKEIQTALEMKPGLVKQNQKKAKEDLERLKR